MTHPERLSTWGQEVSSHLPTLSPAAAWALTLWSCGIVFTQSCGLTSVSVFIAALLHKKENTVRQQLREFCYDSADQRGTNRREVAVERCFADLLRWVLVWWTPEERRVALVLDATTLTQRFTVLAVSVVYRGCAIPVAWVVLPGNAPGSWQPQWERLLGLLAPALPAEWTVLVLADRGLYARWLYKAIQRQGWHPFLRINQQGLFRPHGGQGFRPLASAAPAMGTRWSGTVTCFKGQKSQLECTLLAQWAAGPREPWLIVTDLAPTHANALWYGMRAWIEASFKDAKRGGWHWEQTKMRDPARASRLWLALAVATLWVVRVGADESQDDDPLSGLPDLPPQIITTRPVRRSARARPRCLSAFRRGVLRLLAAVFKQEPFPRGRFHPEPWPDPPQDWPALRPYPPPSELTYP